MASNNQRYEERLEEELAKIDCSIWSIFLEKTRQRLERLSRTCWMNQFLRKRRRVCKTPYFQSLTNQDPHHGKESREKRKPF